MNALSLRIPSSMFFFRNKMGLPGVAGALILCAVSVPAVAQVEKASLKFSQGWLFQATQAQFPLTADKDYWKAEGLEVAIDRGSGSATSVQRVVSGAYDLAYADVGTVIKWNLENPGRELLMVYVAEDACPLVAVSLKKTGITKPKDLEGKRMGAPNFDGGRQMFPVFAKVNGLDTSKISWLSMDANLREQMLVRGEVDAITGFLTSAVPSLAAIGAKPADLNIVRYDTNGLDCYGNAVIAMREFVEKNPRTIGAFVKGLNRGMKEMVADPKAGVEALKGRDPLINADNETQRMALYIKELLLTPNVKANGFSSVSQAKLQKSIESVIEAFGAKTTVTAASLYTDRFLPPKADRIPPAYKE
ncbi:ABC transporter substrate-binding protein [Variovorax sp. VNK109]|uniref:ABC transporter substrate-binding protein n=1 Tax=Variovorax sp. VNK109 TaxID=3400919 RepID=UPI003C00889E